MRPRHFGTFEEFTGPNTAGRKGAVGTAFAFAFSPAAAVGMGYFGYYAFAGFVNAVLPEGSLGGILIRAGTIFIVGIAWLRCWRFRDGIGGLAVLPVTLFFLAYLLRLVENVVFSSLEIPPGNDKVFLFFLVSTILPSYMLASMCCRIDDRTLSVVIPILCVTFLLGLALNYDALMNTAESRLSLDKINPISMANLAAAFLIYYYLNIKKSNWFIIQAAAFVPLLLLIVVLAKSRGAYLAAAAAILTYIILLRGSRRLWALAGLGAFCFITVAYLAPEYFEVVTHNLARITSGTDMSTEMRRQSFDGAWQQFLNDFWVGRYAIELSTWYYPHNIFLESLMAVGFIGSIPFAWHFVLALRASVGIIRSQRFPHIATLSAVLFFQQILIQAASGNVWGAAEFWITSLMVIAFWYGRPDPRRPPGLNAPQARRQSAQRHKFVRAEPLYGRG